MSVHDPSLRQSDHSSVFGWRPPLGVKGAKVYLQTKDTHGRSKPSKIPRAKHTSERPLPLLNDRNGVVLNQPLQPGSVAGKMLQNNQQGTVGVEAPTAAACREKEAGSQGDGDGRVTASVGKSGVAKKPKPVAVKQDLVGRKQLPQHSGRVSSGSRVGRGGGGVGGGVQKTATTSRRTGLHGGEVKLVKKGVRNRDDKTAVQTKMALRKRSVLIAHTRQKFLCRKYSGVWGSKVFGRVLPSVARRHHHLRLQKLCFGVWNQQWWCARREWKLNIRAECHNRYRLWILVWKRWTEFVSDRRQRKAVKKSAASHNERRLKRKAWSGWCVYQRKRRGKTASSEVAKQWHMARVLRCGWVKWRRSLQSKRESDVMLSTALDHWTTRLKAQMLMRWVAKYQEKVVEKEKSVLAEHHWRVRQEAACWSAWVVYVEHRRRKKHMRGVAVKSWCVSVLGKYFTVWQHRLQWSRQLAQFQQLVTERGVRAVKRRALTQWRFYMELVLHDQHLLQVATSHHHSSLKCKALHRLRGYCKRQHFQRAHKATAQKFYNHKVLRYGWYVWLQRCEHCEEIKMLPLTRRARQHFRQCTLQRVFPALKTFLAQRRHQKAQLAQADLHFRSHALPKCFAALRCHVAIRCYKRELCSHALDFRRENLLSMVFYEWWRVYQLSHDLQSLERAAVIHSEGVVKRAALKVWRLKTRYQLQQHSREHAAVDHHHRRLLLTALHRWKVCREARALAVQLSASAVHHYTHKSMARVWGAWMTYVERKRRSKARCAHGTVHYHKTLFSKAWRGWQKYHCHALRKKEKRASADKFCSVMTERHTLRQWWSNVQHLQSQRRLAEMALAHFEKTVYHKCFAVWRGRTIQSLETARRETERVEELSSVLRQGKLVRVFASWREYTSGCVARRIVNERALVHSHHHLVWSCFVAWYKYHQLAQRKMLLSRQCAHFERSRLVSTFYAKWRIELMRTVAMKRKSTLALWHWSQCLQRKALVCWVLYAMNRKRKKERYAQALQRHRHRLLHIGVTQWIMFATSMESQRMESSLKHQEEVSLRTMQCVRRCVCRWKAAVRKRKRMHQDSLTGKEPSMKINLAAKKTQIQSQIGEDFWSSITRKHHLSDETVHRRPQPRQSNYLRSLSRDAVLFPDTADLAPRQDTPHPPTPPVLYGQRQRPAHSDEQLAATCSFTFLPSTCSELSSVGPWQAVQPSTACEKHEPHLSTKPTPIPAGHPPAAVLATTQQPSPRPAQPTHQTTLLPPSAFERPRTAAAPISHLNTAPTPHLNTAPTPHLNTAPTPHLNTAPTPHLNTASLAPPLTTPLTAREKVAVSGMSQAGESGAAATAATDSGVSVHAGKAVAGLGDPAVRSHIVHVRNELRKYHEMKTRQKVVEQQLAESGEGSDDRLAELQAELSRIGECLHRTEPIIREMVAQVQKIVSENQ